MSENGPTEHYAQDTITLFNGVKYEEEAHKNIFVETHAIVVPKACFQEKSH